MSNLLIQLESKLHTLYIPCAVKMKSTHFKACNWQKYICWFK